MYLCLAKRFDATIWVNRRYNPRNNEELGLIQKCDPCKVYAVLNKYKSESQLVKQCETISPVTFPAQSLTTTPISISLK